MLPGSVSRILAEGRRKTSASEQHRNVPPKLLKQTDEHLGLSAEAVLLALRAKMELVLQAGKQQATATRAAAAASSTYRALHSKYEGFAWGEPDTEALAQSQFDECEMLCREYFAAESRNEKAKSVKARARQDFATACLDFCGFVDGVQAERPDLPDNETLRAAAYLRAQIGTIEEYPHPGSDQWNATTANGFAEIEPRLYTAAREWLIIASNCNAVRKKLADVLTKRHQLRISKVEEPRRPTEEEVQRFLHGLDHYMLERRKLEFEILALETELDKGKALADAAAKVSALLEPLVTKNADLVTRQISGKPAAQDTAGFCSYLLGSLPCEMKTVAALTVFVASFAATVQQQISQLKKARHTDLLKLPTRSPAEAAEIAQVREMLRAIAFAKGRLNEASFAHEAANLKHPPSIQLSGAGYLSTWQECLSWADGKYEEQSAADLAHLAIRTRQELLRESVEAANKELQESRAPLRRHVLRRVKRVGGMEPCDELRDLLKLGDWICRQSDGDPGAAYFYGTAAN